MLRKSVLLLLQGLLTVQGYYVSECVVVACLGVLSDCAFVHCIRDIVYCLGDIMYVIVGLFTVFSPGDCVSDCVIVHCFGDLRIVHFLPSLGYCARYCEFGTLCWVICRLVYRLRDIV